MALCVDAKINKNAAKTAVHDKKTHRKIIDKSRHAEKRCDFNKK
jgi:hypothetical protein